MPEEYRYAPLEFRSDGAGLVEGVVVKYGDVARIPIGGEIYRERIEPGAFEDLSDVVLNQGHDQSKPVARTGGGGLVLEDNAERLFLRAELANTSDGRDVRELLSKRILAGPFVWNSSSCQAGKNTTGRRGPGR